MTACASEAAQYRQYLQISELARNRLEAEHAALQHQVEQLQRQVGSQQQELHVLQAHPAALTELTVTELTALEGETWNVNRAPGEGGGCGRPALAMQP